MLRPCLIGVALLLTLLIAAGCDDFAVPPDHPTEVATPTDELALEQQSEKAVFEMSVASLGEPIPGISPELLARFEAGKEEFEEEESAEEGLGPVFNDVSCVACHAQGAVGGAGDLIETRFGMRMPNGRFDPLSQYGGSLIQSQGIAYGDCAQPPEEVPAEANVIAGRQTTALFGLGLLDAVPEWLIRLRADPFDWNRDGVSGRVNMVMSPATNRMEVGRFGWKAQVSSVLVFSGDAYLNEMGITSYLFPTESSPNGKTPSCYDGIEDDPEDEDADANGMSDNVEEFTDFMRLLAPPPAAGRPTAAVIRGARLFARTMCASCHTPALATGFVRDIPALSRRIFYPFTDLLLHDMGSLGDGIEQGQAKGDEMRTAPLWGLRESAPYLHDGRVKTIADAIAAHDGEGRRARDAFLRLTPQESSDLIAFLSFI